MTARPDPPVSPPRRRFLQRLVVTGGSVAAVSWAGPLAGGVAAGSDADSASGPSSTDEYLPGFDGGPPGAAIQASVDAAAAAGGGTVLIPTGEHVLTEDLRLPANVTLRGMSWTGSRLVSGPDEPVAVVIEDDAEGVAVETLSVPSLRFGEAASFCVLRRIRVLDAPGDAITLPTVTAHHLSLEQVTIESCGADGIRHGATDSQGVFLSEVAVTGFGLAVEGARGVRVSGRAHLCQIHVEPVGDGQVGIGFEAGSELSTLTNFTMRLDGGTAVLVEPDDLPIARGVGAVG